MTDPNEKYPVCKDARDWCKAKRDGRCLALTETYPEGKLCPFYKKITDDKNIPTHEA